MTAESPTPALPPAPSVQIQVRERSFSTEEATSFYNELRGKSNQIRGLSRSAFRLNQADLKTLSKRLSEVVNPYIQSEQNVAIYVEIENESMLRFSTIESFSSYEFSESSPTVRINLDLAFLTKSFSSGSITEFRIDLYLTSGVALCQIESKDGNNFDDLPFPLDTMNYTINFQDYTLARACAGIIEDWLKGLRNVEVDPLQVYLYKNRRLIRLGVHLSCLSFCGLLLIGLGSVLSLFYGFGPVEIITLNVAFLFFANRIASALSARAQASLRRIAAHSYIQLTNGDQNCFEWYTRRRRTSVWVWGVTIVSAIMINVIGGIIANMLPSIK